MIQKSLKFQIISYKLRKRMKHFIFQLLFLIMLILTFSLLWAKNNYGNISFDEIIFHLNMPLKGTANEFTSDQCWKNTPPNRTNDAVYMVDGNGVLDYISYLDKNYCATGMR